ncbi:tyrosine-type recombinase/integrase [Oscillochloris sp. ZM17-4]|uniref:tyrosine-type recombinase/integrase n=1 Tax=Oscillochloris sp. ZM17-4 TaxID=2866714 RepID=UPI001C73E0DA|nr:tyrosine-type recombinase/integrase [Oscillochloris sp. ZM17-4]MBX0329693.1 tyrosine-type recombinase/integrase [Oscillochloris sp. ZM17-4]
MDTLHPDLEAYLAELDGVSANTRRARRADLAGLSRWWAEERGRAFDPALLAERDVRAYLQQRQVADGAAPASINRALSTGSRCWAWLVQTDRARENPFTPVGAVPQDPPAPRKLDPTAVDALLRAASDEPDVTLRRCNEALLSLLIYAGLRSQEAADVQLRDLDLDGRTVTVRSGKAGKFGRVPLHADAVRLLRRYLTELRCPDGMPAAGSPAERERLLGVVESTRPGRPFRAGISTRTIRHRFMVIATRAAAQLRAAAQKKPRLDKATKLREAADDLETASPHALRHSLAYRLLDDGASLAAVQRIMRHSRGEQTLRYATPNSRDLKDVIDRSGGV